MFAREHRQSGRQGSDISKFPNATQSTSRNSHDETISESTSRRIHILGIGSIGVLISHSLMCLQRPPQVTLLLHRPDLVEKFKLNNETVRLVNRKKNTTDERYGYDLEVLEVGCQHQIPQWRQVGNSAVTRDLSIPEGKHSDGKGLIHSLIVACKAPATVSAIRNLRHRINAKTTICLMQNGMGQVDELNQELFTNIDERPACILGIVSHGLYLADNFTAIHAGHGTIALGVVRNLEQPSDAAPHFSASSEHLLSTLVQADSLGCSRFEYQELLQLQLEKLAVNCLLNPLTALLDVPNGQMLNNAPLSSIHH
jgi:2-dehydropantoate 2-reductase